MTNTLTTFWGSGQYSQRFFLNDQLRRFSIGRHGANVADQLRQRGYASLTVPPRPLYFGSVQALEADHDAGTVTGAADDRREAAFEVATP